MFSIAAINLTAEISDLPAGENAPPRRQMHIAGKPQLRNDGAVSADPVRIEAHVFGFAGARQVAQLVTDQGDPPAVSPGAMLDVPEISCGFRVKGEGALRAVVALVLRNADGDGETLWCAGNENGFAALAAAPDGLET